MLISALCFYNGAAQHSDGFPVGSGKDLVSVIYDNEGTAIDSIAAVLLAEDMERVTGIKPVVKPYNKIPDTRCVLIGNASSKFIKSFLKESLPPDFLDQKESYYRGLSKPGANGAEHFIIAGTDARGTAFGVFAISEQMGVNPWYWWADVPVKKQATVLLPYKSYFSKQPSVAYRGIFLNDEDWGLQPWAAKTFEKETGDIGPKTYAKIFELLLRLKANTIWPAMHPSTKAFFYYKGNPEMARKYNIVIGTSHAEPMLRNNVDEWKPSFGKFDYKNNKAKVAAYWEARVKEAKGLYALYTMGIRGVHDSGMEGVSGIEEATSLLNKVIADQRDMLQRNLGMPADKIPQVFTVYKEVLALYDNGMKVPDDITLVWTDDNYGYIHRLSDAEEQLRKGGSGVYYHNSYWGRPHDYLWLCTTPPGLIKEEMLKAYKRNARQVWIVNVGDIKPGEYAMQLFLDMAYNTTPFLQPDYLQRHTQNFYTAVFGGGTGKDIALLKEQFYRLALERKPEYMGWSQTEPTTKVKQTDYNPFAFGDEISKRLQEYHNLSLQSDALYRAVPGTAKDAYFQLVHYPVKGAAFMNQKHLYRDLALKYNEDARLAAKQYAVMSQAAHDSIVVLTGIYNTTIARGKWNGMMSAQPRNLPVFDKPDIAFKNNADAHITGFSVEGGKNTPAILPTFYSGFNDSYFIDVFLKQEGNVQWSVSRLPLWLTASKRKGTLSSGKNILQERITFKVNWSNIKQSALSVSGNFYLRIGNEKHTVTVKAAEYAADQQCKECFYEKNGYAVAYAANYEHKVDEGDSVWQEFNSLGHSGSLMQALPLNTKPCDTLQITQNHASLSYTFVTETLTPNAELIIGGLPTHPLSRDHKVRFAVSWDNEPPVIVNFETFGRSEQWKQNVLKNLATVLVPVAINRAGRHSVTLYMIDQGVCLDFIYLKTKPSALPYAILPQTKIPDVHHN